MTSSMKAAIHLGRNFQENSEIFKNMKVENIENVFNITPKLVKEQSEEILNVKTLVQRTKWYSNSEKLFILFSQLPVL